MPKKLAKFSWKKINWQREISQPSSHLIIALIELALLVTCLSLISISKSSLEIYYSEPIDQQGTTDLSGLATTGIVSGLTTDVDGNPLAETELTIKISPNQEKPEQLVITNSNARGVYTLNLNPGNYYLTAEKNGFASPTKTAVVNSGQMTIIHFDLAPRSLVKSFFNTN